MFLSTSEAEFVAASRAGQEAIYLRETLTDFGYSQFKATLLYEDNLACIAMSENPVRRKFSRHIDIKQYFVRELVLAGFLKLVPLRTHTKWWLAPSPRACCHRHSSGTNRSWLVMSLLPLASYVASGANFERWLWALRFRIFFAWLPMHFFSPPTLCPGYLSCVWFFSSASLFIILFLHVFTFLYFLWVCPILSLQDHTIVHGGDQYQRPRTRSATARQVSNAHEQDLVTNKIV